jgi:hypothetical protein
MSEFSLKGLKFIFETTDDVWGGANNGVKLIGVNTCPSSATFQGWQYYDNITNVIASSGTATIHASISIDTTYPALKIADGITLLDPGTSPGPKGYIMYYDNGGASSTWPILALIDSDTGGFLGTGGTGYTLDGTPDSMSFPGTLPDDKLIAIGVTINTQVYGPWFQRLLNTSHADHGDVRIANGTWYIVGSNASEDPNLSYFDGDVDVSAITEGNQTGKALSITTPTWNLVGTPPTKLELLFNTAAETLDDDNEVNGYGAGPMDNVHTFKTYSGSTFSPGSALPGSGATGRADTYLVGVTEGHNHTLDGVDDNYNYGADGGTDGVLFDITP